MTEAQAWPRTSSVIVQWTSGAREALVEDSPWALVAKALEEAAT